jgi:hypothetical protein
MNQIIDSICKAIENGSAYLWGVVCFLMVKPLQVFFRKIGYWISEGFNADIVAKILRPFQNKLASFEKRIDKQDKHIEQLNCTTERILQHVKNNEKYVKDMFESLNEKK